VNDGAHVHCIVVEGGQGRPECMEGYTSGAFFASRRTSTAECTHVGQLWSSTSSIREKLSNQICGVCSCRLGVGLLLALLLVCAVVAAMQQRCDLACPHLRQSVLWLDVVVSVWVVARTRIFEVWDSIRLPWALPACCAVIVV
jgi:hypothetical protein